MVRSSTSGSGSRVTARGAAVCEITGNVTGENLEMVVPQPVQNLLLPLMIMPQHWQIWMSKTSSQAQEVARARPYAPLSYVPIKSNW